MKQKDVRALSTYLLPHLPGYRYKGTLIYAEPARPVLRAFCFEKSGFDAAGFYLRAFVQPLFVPTDHINFNTSMRLHAGKWWSLDEPGLIENLLRALIDEGIPLHAAVKAPADLPALIKAKGPTSNPYDIETVGYAQIWSGDIGAGCESLVRLIARLDREVGWEAKMQDRAIRLKSLVEEDPAEAKRCLEQWEAETARNLKLVSSPALE